jgi:hypothetical protein
MNNSKKILKNSIYGSIFNPSPFDFKDLYDSVEKINKDDNDINSILDVIEISYPSFTEYYFLRRKFNLL